jgi:hypothetical protein
VTVEFPVAAAAAVRLDAFRAIMGEPDTGPRRFLAQARAESVTNAAEVA